MQIKEQKYIAITIIILLLLILAISLTLVIKSNDVEVNSYTLCIVTNKGYNAESDKHKLELTNYYKNGSTQTYEIEVNEPTYNRYSIGDKFP